MSLICYILSNILYRSVTKVLHISYPRLKVCDTQIHISCFDYTIANIDKRILNIVSEDKWVQNNI